MTTNQLLTKLFKD